MNTFSKANVDCNVKEHVPLNNNIREWLTTVFGVFPLRRLRSKYNVIFTYSNSFVCLFVCLFVYWICLCWITLYLYNNVASVCIFIGCWPRSIKGHTQMASNPRQVTSRHVTSRQRIYFTFFMPPGQILKKFIWILYFFVLYTLWHLLWSTTVHTQENIIYLLNNGNNDNIKRKVRHVAQWATTVYGNYSAPRLLKDRLLLII